MWTSSRISCQLLSRGGVPPGWRTSRPEGRDSFAPLKVTTGTEDNRHSAFSPKAGSRVCGVLIAAATESAGQVWTSHALPLGGRGSRAVGRVGCSQVSWCASSYYNSTQTAVQCAITDVYSIVIRWCKLWYRLRPRRRVENQCRYCAWVTNPPPTIQPLCRQFHTRLLLSMCLVYIYSCLRPLPPLYILVK